MRAAEVCATAYGSCFGTAEMAKSRLRSMATRAYPGWLRAVGWLAGGLPPGCPPDMLEVRVGRQNVAQARQLAGGLDLVVRCGGQHLQRAGRGSGVVAGPGRVTLAPTAH